MNLVILAPLSLLGALAFQSTRWQDWTAYGFLGAVAMEMTQGLLLPERTASFSDIVANGLGAFVGALVAGLWMHQQLGPERSPSNLG